MKDPRLTAEIRLKHPKQAELWDLIWEFCTKPTKEQELSDGFTEGFYDEDYLT